VIERDPLVRRLLGLPLPIAPPVLRATVGEIYRQLVFARPRSAEAAVVAAFAAHHASRARVAALLASGRRLLPELSTSPFRFEQVRCPVLLIWGTRDRMVPHTGAQILLEALPHTHLELLEDVGHCPQLEATDRLLELLLPFPAAVRA
jgi:pimeloyl-ACP methyl ester carboxylesterase